MTTLHMRITGHCNPYETFRLRDSDPGEVLVRRSNNDTVILECAERAAQDCINLVYQYYGIRLDPNELQACETPRDQPITGRTYEIVMCGELHPTDTLVWTPVTPSTPSVPTLEEQPVRVSGMTWRVPESVAGDNQVPGSYSEYINSQSHNLQTSPIWGPVEAAVPVAPQAPEAVEYPATYSETLAEHQIEQMPSITRRRRRRYMTLMPFSSFKKTAQCLSDRDLRFMRIAALRVLRAYTTTPGGLNDARRKAIALWTNNKAGLCKYGIAIAEEMANRGFENTSIHEFTEGLNGASGTKPAWVFWPRMQNAHKSYLKLRGMRDNFVKRLHTHLKELGNTEGVRAYLQSVDLKNVRNMKFDDLMAVDSESINKGHYNDLFVFYGAHEEYVYPEPLQSN